MLDNSDHDGITVNAAPAAYPASNSPVLEGDTIYLFGGPGGMTSYYWTGPGGFNSTEENPVIPNATLAMTGNYTLTIVDYSGCGSASNSTSVIVSARGPAYGAVGWETRQINKLRVLIPWTALGAVIAVGVSLLAVRCRRA